MRPAFFAQAWACATKRSEYWGAMVFMKSERRTFKTRSTKYSSSQGAARARWPLKMTRSKQESTATMRLVNLVTKRDSVFMAFSSGKGLCKPYSEGRTPSLLILFGCGYAALGSVPDGREVM